MSAKIAVGRYASMGGEWPWGQQRLRLHTDFKPIPAILFWNLSTGLCFCGPQGNYHLLLLENIKPIIASRMSVWFKLVIQLDWWEGTRWALLGLEPGSKLESGSDRLICLLGISCSSNRAAEWCDSGAHIPETPGRAQSKRGPRVSTLFWGLHQAQDR